MEDPDLELVRAAQGGDTAAFDALMTRHQEKLHRFIYRTVWNVQDALDLTQEAFVRAYLHIGGFKPKAKFATWLYRIAMNLCRDHFKSSAFRRRAVMFPLPEQVDSEEHAWPELAADQPAVEQNLAHQERLAQVQAVIDRLPANLREPLVLAVLEDKPHQEVGAILGISAKAVEMRVYRARQELAGQLKQESE